MNEKDFTINCYNVSANPTSGSRTNNSENASVNVDKSGLDTDNTMYQYQLLRMLVIKM